MQNIQQIKLVLLILYLWDGIEIQGVDHIVIMFDRKIYLIRKQHQTILLQTVLLLKFQETIILYCHTNGIYPDCGYIPTQKTKILPLIKWENLIQLTTAVLRM